MYNYCHSKLGLQFFTKNEYFSTINIARVVWTQSRSGDSNTHCTSGRDQDQIEINGSRSPYSYRQEIMSTFWYRSNNEELTLCDQYTILPYTLTHDYSATTLEHTYITSREFDPGHGC